jgi:DNA-binding NarL/FixJ family response regulator
VCEDDPTVRRVIESVLRERGIEVIAEIDVITPIFDLIRYGKPDVVVLDLVLMGMSGAEGLDDLGAIASEVPVVVFSAHDALRQEALARGAHAFVDKPNFEELADAVAELVDQVEHQS